MSHSQLHRVLGLLNLFLGLTAVGGGIGLIGGWIPVPASLLVGSPFTDYAIPGLLLIFLVGMPALVASLLIHVRLRAGIRWSAIAAGAITIFEIVEIGVIGFTPLQAVYIAIGAAIFISAAWLGLMSRSFPALRPALKPPEATA